MVTMATNQLIERSIVRILGGQLSMESRYRGSLTLHLHEAGGEWRSSDVLYMVGIAVGTVVYPIGPIVAIHYLLSRRRRLEAG
jgi:hypothetical protein